MPEDSHSDDTGAGEPTRSKLPAPRPRRKLFAFLGFVWLAVGIVWLIDVVASGPTVPWRIAIGVLFVLFGIGYIFGWLRSKRSASRRKDDQD